MAEVLIVDDVPEYCDELASGLGRDGHHVTVAYDGREAIQLGKALQPDILVADWMLKDQVSGLDVFDALKVVCPCLEAILITGYASQDLRTDVQHADVFDFLEKPFRLDDIRKAVQGASAQKRWWRFPVKVGFIHTDVKGEILFANACAEDMMEQTEARAFAPNLNDLFRPEQADLLRRCRAEWVEVIPRAERPMKWLVYGQEFARDKERTYVILDSSQAHFRHSRLVRCLLGLNDAPPQTKPRISGHILVMDDLESVRRVTAEVLKELECVFHTAESYSEAVRLFVHDSLISHVILDYQMPSGNPDELVKLIRTLRPETKIIGTSAANVREDFSKLGVNSFLRKPWLVDELIAMLLSLEHDKQTH